MIFQVDKVTVPLQKRSMNGGKISSSCPIIIFSLRRKSECDVGHLTFSHNHRDNNGELWRITHDILLAASKKGAWGQKSSSLSLICYTMRVVFFEVLVLSSFHLQIIILWQQFKTRHTLTYSSNTHVYGKRKCKDRWKLFENRKIRENFLWNRWIWAVFKCKFLISYFFTWWMKFFQKIFPSVFSNSKC